jgi:hypothetical protein
MTEPNQQEQSVARHDPEWLLSPSLPPGARLQISSLIEAEQLTPEVLELLAKFMKDLQQIEKKPAPDPCPKLEVCEVHKGPCSALTSCGTFTLKVATF